MKHSIILSLAISLFSFFAAYSGETLADTVSDDSISEDIFGSDTLVSYEELDENRGTFDPVSSNYMFGTNYGNTANNTVSGSNYISDGSFNGASGVVSVIQNSGNNVLIQSSMIVNVEMNQ